MNGINNAINKLIKTTHPTTPKRRKTQGEGGEGAGGRGGGAALPPHGDQLIKVYDDRQPINRHKTACHCQRMCEPDAARCDQRPPRRATYGPIKSVKWNYYVTVQTSPRTCLADMYVTA